MKWIKLIISFYNVLLGSWYSCGCFLTTYHPNTAADQVHLMVLAFPNCCSPPLPTGQCTAKTFRNDSRNMKSSQLSILFCVSVLMLWLIWVLWVRWGLHSVLQGLLSLWKDGPLPSVTAVAVRRCSRSAAVFNVCSRTLLLREDHGHSLHLSVV